MSEAKRRKVVQDASRTVSTSGYYLIGHSSEYISHCKLPTLRQVLQYLLYIKESCVKTTKTQDCLYKCVNEVVTIWNMARIPQKQKSNIVKMLRQVYDTWLGLKKNITRSRDTGGRRQAFCDKLDMLWDIGRCDAILSLITNMQLSPSEKIENIAFYEDQRHSRSARIAGKDKSFERSLVKIPTQISEGLVAASPGKISDDKVATKSRYAVWSDRYLNLADIEENQQTNSSSPKSADYQSENLKKYRASTDHPYVDEYQAWCECATAVLRRMDAVRARQVMTLFAKHLSSPRRHGRNHANGYNMEAEGSDITAKELKVENIGQKRSIFATRPFLRLSEPVCNNSFVETDEALDEETKQQIEQIKLLKMEIELLQVEHDARMAMYDKRFPYPIQSFSTFETSNDEAPTADHV